MSDGIYLTHTVPIVKVSKQDDTVRGVRIGILILSTGKQYVDSMGSLREPVCACGPSSRCRAESGGHVLEFGVQSQKLVLSKQAV